MKIKKTWFSYVLWVIFSIILFASVGVSAVGMSQQGSIMDYLPSIGMFYFAFIAGAAAFIGILILYNKFIKGKIDFSELQGIHLIEIFSVIIFILIAAAVRVFILITNYDSLLGTDQYFNLAAGMDRSVMTSLTNGDVFYVNILSLVIRFLGNKPLAAMVLQIIFQVMSLILLYPMVKWAIGAMAAWAAMILFAFLPGSFQGITHATPDSMLVFFLLVFLFFLSLINHLAKENKLFTPLQIGLFILLGVIGGLVTYFDIIGAALLLITAFSLFSIRSDVRDMGVQKPVVQFIVFLLSFLAALALCIYFLSGILRGGLSAFHFFAGQFIPADGISFTLLNPHSGNYDVLALYLLAGVWFVAFLRMNLDRGFPYVCLIVFSTIYVFLGLKTGTYSAVCSLAWILLASVGFTSADAFGEQEFVPKKAPAAKPVKQKKKSKAPEPVKEPIRFAKSSDKNNTTPLVPSGNSSASAEISNGIEVKKVPQPPRPAESTGSSYAHSAPVPPKSTAAAPAAPVPPKSTAVSHAAPVPPRSTAEPAKPRMLKNPLPEPKPHVPKEMNYDYFPKPSEMHYDLTDLRGKEYYDI